MLPRLVFAGVASTPLGALSMLTITISDPCPTICSRRKRVTFPLRTGRRTLSGLVLFMGCTPFNFAFKTLLVSCLKRCSSTSARKLFFSSAALQSLQLNAEFLQLFLFFLALRGVLLVLA